MPRQYADHTVKDVLFRRNYFRRFCWSLIILLFLTFGAIGLLYYQLLTVKIPPHFATTSDGRLIELIPRSTFPTQNKKKQ